MMLLWLISGAALLLSAAALFQAVRVSNRLGRISQSYWDLRYEHDRLRARLEGTPPADSPRKSRQPEAGTTYVPLSSVRDDTRRSYRGE
jgi:hypothetical protein